MNLAIQRFEEIELEKKTIQEINWLRTRKIWVLLINYMRDSKVKPTAFKETDLITLSFDTESEEQENKLMSPEEVESLFPKTLPK